MFLSPSSGVTSECQKDTGKKETLLRFLDNESFEIVPRKELETIDSFEINEHH